MAHEVRVLFGWTQKLLESRGQLGFPAKMDMFHTMVRLKLRWYFFPDLVLNVGPKMGLVGESSTMSETFRFRNYNLQR